MYRLLIIRFLRSKVSVIALLVLLGAGFAAIGIGKKYYNRQLASEQETTRHQKEHIERLVQYENREFGLLMYYLKFAYINPTQRLSALSIGQRDINSSIQSLTIRTLEAQKYDNGNSNAYTLMSGNFDLSFVVVYLFPLVIIGLCFRLYSEEKETGTWTLVTSQSKSAGKYLLLKLSVPYIFTLAVFLLLAVSALIILKLKPGMPVLAYCTCSILYLSFWFALCLLAASFKRNSSINALALAGAWLLFTILLPAAINNYITRKYAAPEAFSAMLKQRDGYHNKWDIPQDSTMKLFFAAYPEYQNMSWTHDGFNWLWYYAMQHLGDVAAATDREIFYKKLEQREALSNRLSMLLPSAYTQLYHNRLAQSNLGNHLQFLDSTTAFHERLRKYFYPKIFTAAAVKEEDWTKFTPVYCSIKNPARFAESLYPGMFVLLIGLVAFYRIKKININK